MNDRYISPERIRANYYAVLDRISAIACESGRDPDSVRLVAVSKGKSIITIENAIKAGIRIFGENYADEALSKINSLRKHPAIQWHMIGHVQSRKAKIVAEYFDYMHSLDSIKLARRLDKFARDFGKIFPALIEFNLSGEVSKYGFPAWKEVDWKELLPLIEQILALPNVRIEGIMAIPPYSDDPEESRPYYKMLRRLQSFLRENFPDACWSDLSMGMSADYEVAIEEGATWIRVGQALLGPRD
jgi:PLP dependent protein